MKDELPQDFNPGDQVYYSVRPDWGIGTVESVSPERQIVTCRFQPPHGGFQYGCFVGNLSLAAIASEQRAPDVDMQELVERLRTKKPVWAYEADGSPAFDFINPDGPAAADAIERLSARAPSQEDVERAAEALMSHDGLEWGDDAEMQPEYRRKVQAVLAALSAQGGGYGNR